MPRPVNHQSYVDAPQHVLDRILDPSNLDIRPAGWISPCWLSKLPASQNGYVRVSYSIGARGRNGKVLAHRLTFMRLVDPDLPDRLEIDHRCRQRHCVNPGHLRPATHKQNSGPSKRRPWSHCPQGHELTPDNIWRYKSQRCCLTCKIFRVAAAHGYRAKVSA